MCTRSINSASKPELTEKADDLLHGTNKARSERFGFVDSELVRLPSLVQAPGVSTRVHQIIITPNTTTEILVNVAIQNKINKCDPLCEIQAKLSNLIMRKQA